MNKRAYGLSLLSAFLYIIASPPVDIEPLGWLCIAPILFAVNESGSVKDAFKTGFFGGMAASAGLYYWLVYTMTTYGNLSYLLSFLVFLLLALYLALFWGVFASLLKHLTASSLPVIFTAPCLWVSLEYLRTYLFTGFPWALLGYTQYKSPLLIQISDLTGVYGVSFILVLSSAIVYVGVGRYASEKVVPVREVLLLCSFLFLDISYGFVKMHRYGKAEGVVRAALIQGNIDQEIKWDEAYRDETLNIYRSLSRGALVESGDIDIIIWPETAAPFYFQQQGKPRRKLLEISEELNAPILFGSPAYRVEGDKVRYLNSAYLIAPAGKGGEVKTNGRYDKVHLVPFGEYVPLKKLLFFVEKITEGIGDFSPGKGVMTLDLPTDKTASSRISFGPLICYEGIFPDLVRRFVKDGADILVNITNDAWYGRSSAPYQHLSAAIFRAAENGVYMLRVANTGVTAIIDPLGRVESSTGIFESGFITGTVALPRGKTIYTRIGDLFAILVSTATVIQLIYSKLSAVRTTN